MLEVASQLLGYIEAVMFGLRTVKGKGKDKWDGTQKVAANYSGEMFSRIQMRMR